MTRGTQRTSTRGTRTSTSRYKDKYRQGTRYKDKYLQDQIHLIPSVTFPNLQQPENNSRILEGLR